jgi:hypothetical protein
LAAVVSLIAAQLLTAQMISAFPAANEQAAATAQAAFEQADKGRPDPAWRGQKFTIGVYSAGQRGAVSGPLATRLLAAILPPAVLAITAQRYIVRGLTFGAVKG